MNQVFDISPQRVSEDQEDILGLTKELLARLGAKIQEDGSYRNFDPVLGNFIAQFNGSSMSLTTQWGIYKYNLGPVLSAEPQVDPELGPPNCFDDLDFEISHAVNYYLALSYNELNPKFHNIPFFPKV